MPLAGEQLHQDHQGARPPQPPQMPFPPSQQNRADNGDLYELLTPPDCNIQGLTKLSALVNLNLSNNFISQLTNLAHLPNLHTFSVSRLLKVHVTMSEILRAENSFMPIPFLIRNKLKTSEDIRELESCKKLSVLDISYNSLEEPDVLEVLAKMPELHVLTSTGNPIIRKTRDYRRNVLYR